MCSMVEDIKRVLEKLQKMDVKALACYDVKLEDEILQHYINENAASFKRPAKAMGELPPWERMCYYKVSGTKGTDCDVALFNMVVYYLAYGLGEKGWKIRKYYSKYQLKKPKTEGIDWVLCGDTMNSYATSVRGYIRDIWKPGNKEKMKDEEILDEKGYVNSAFEENYWEDVILRHDGYFRNVLPRSAQEYIRLNHTIGNFIPVPFISAQGGQFNSPRGIGPSNDYWDLALLAIYHYYHKDFSIKAYPSFALRCLLGDTANVRLCQDWLDSFEGAVGEEKWNRFVEQNFLQNFVKDGMPLPLWEGHFTGEVMPKNEEHYNDFFTNASSWIAARGETIAKKIKEVLKNNDLTALAKEMVYG